MIEVRGLSATYGQHPALQEVSLRVEPGEIVVILGANGAGKSTLLRAIAGICEGRVNGDVLLDGRSIRGLSPYRVVEAGIALVPEGRGIFGELSVQENLVLGAYSRRARLEESSNLGRVLELFPVLRERRSQIVRTMSGGEQQMVAIGRAMMSAPNILMLDEPSLGLSPYLCKELFQNLATVKRHGIGVLLVEQNAKQSLAIADRGYLLENTRITHEDSAAALSRDPAVQKAYLGAGGRASEPRADAPEREEAAAAPEPPTVRAGPPPRRTAEQQIGIPIESLVAGAARISSERSSDIRLRAADPASDSRLVSMLKEIENAAAAARRLPAGDAELPASSRKDSATNGPAAEGDRAAHPVIEIYRRPRVEVYRRSPDGSFRKD